MMYRKDDREDHEDDFPTEFLPTLRRYIHVPVVFSLVLGSFFVFLAMALDKC